MRHAKSDWSDPTVSDHDRKLNKRGKKAAPLMGQRLKKLGIMPDLIISSSAKRAHKTAKLFAKTNNPNVKIKLDNNLYHTDFQDIIETIKTADNINTLMLVGHNPGFEIFAGLLLKKNISMPTAAIAVASVNIKNWADFDVNLCTPEIFIKPKDKQ